MATNNHVGGRGQPTLIPTPQHRTVGTERRKPAQAVEGKNTRRSTRGILVLGRVRWKIEVEKEERSTRSRRGCEIVKRVGGEECQIKRGMLVPIGSDYPDTTCESLGGGPTRSVGVVGSRQTERSSSR